MVSNVLMLSRFTSSPQTPQTHHHGLPKASRLDLEVIDPAINPEKMEMSLGAKDEEKRLGLAKACFFFWGWLSGRF